MAAPTVLLAKAAALALTDENARKGIGWCIVAILSPIIILLALLCSVAAGTAEHNVSAAEFCFSSVALPADLPEEYKASIENMRAHFAELDTILEDIGSRTEGDESLDEIRVKAIFMPCFSVPKRLHRLRQMFIKSLWIPSRPLRKRQGRSPKRMQTATR